LKATINKEYDIVITGRRLIDPETGLDAVRKVGIKGDKLSGGIAQFVAGEASIAAADKDTEDE
jgi:predicted amidohydrolase